MHYTSPESAKADLALRRQMAQEGISLNVGQPYNETLFTLDEASVEGSDLVFQVSPISGMPRRLFDMVIADDMLFASCP